MQEKMEPRHIQAQQASSGRYKNRDVPCKGCSACCFSDAVSLLPNEVPFFEHEPHILKRGIPSPFMLAHKKSGECFYLGLTGCTIYERRPQRCREMDCRNIARAVSYEEISKPGVSPRMLQVWQKGKELLKHGGE